MMIGKSLGSHQCLGEGCLGLPGQVWNLRFLLSFPLLATRHRNSKKVWDYIFLPDTSTRHM